MTRCTHGGAPCPRPRYVVPEEAPSDFWKALGVMLLLVAAAYCMVIAVAGYVPAVPA